MIFLSTPSARRATDLVEAGRISQEISIHALCEEGDPCRTRCSRSSSYFYPRPLRGGRRRTPLASTMSSYFYPRPLRGGRLLNDTIYFADTAISIHALCEEGDFFIRLASWSRSNFYPRPLRGGRPVEGLEDKIMCLFLSTPSARRATGCIIDPLHFFLFLSTPSARRATDEVQKMHDMILFLSTPSARRATCLDLRQDWNQAISIHALCEEGDSKNGEKHLCFCFIIKRSAQIWKSLSKNIRKNSCDLHRTA